MDKLDKFITDYTGKGIDTDGALTSSQYIDIMGICQKVLKDFKKEIKATKTGKVVQIIQEKTIPTMVERIPQKLKKNYAFYILMRAVLLGKAIMSERQQFIDGLKKEYQNQNFVLDVKLDLLKNYQIMVTRIKEILLIGNGFVKNVMQLKMVEGGI